jgi:uncharacterized protein YbjT (DUF2867 family)
MDLRMGKTALLVGSTGLIGSQLLDLLLIDDRYDKIITISRRSINRTHDKLKEYIVDFDHLEKSKEAFQVMDVYCCLGTTMKKAGSKAAFTKVDFEYPFEVAKMAKEMGAEKYLLVSALGSDNNSNIFYNKVKGEVEEAISELQFKSYHIFRPSLLIGPRIEVRVGEKIGQIIMKAIGFLFIGSLKKYKGIESIKVARAMIVKAKMENEGQFYHDSDQLQKF